VGLDKSMNSKVVTDQVRNRAICDDFVSITSDDQVESVTVEMSGTVDMLREAEGMEDRLKLDGCRVCCYIGVNVKVSHYK